MKAIKYGMRLGAVIMLAVTGGCDSGSSGGGPSGRSTITGNVSTFPASGSGVVAGVSQSGGSGGIRVELSGTDLSGTTANDGSFIISGVPGGVQTVEFSRDGIQKSIGITVPEHGVVHMDDVLVSASGIRIQHLSTEVEDDSGNGTDDGPDHDLGDDHGADGAGHDVGDDHGGSGKKGHGTDNGSGHT